MNDRIDHAIDRVAKRLTQVEDDAQFASLIVRSLPERTTWFGWLMHSWVPRLAVLAIIVTAAALWTRRDRSIDSPLVSVAQAQLIELIAPVQPMARVEPRTLGTRPLEPLEPVEPLEPDHEHSLAALSVDALAADALPVEGSLSVPSLEIADLPLTAESFPQRD